MHFHDLPPIWLEEKFPKKHFFLKKIMFLAKEAIIHIEKVAIILKKI
jgi:hypothetical protein